MVEEVMAARKPSIQENGIDRATEPMPMSVVCICKYKDDILEKSCGI